MNNLECVCKPPSGPYVMWRCKHGNVWLGGAAKPSVSVPSDRSALSFAGLMAQPILRKSKRRRK